MQQPTPYTVNIRGRLMDLSVPRVMGILNVTPDSFYAESRQQTDDAIAARAEQLLAEGADIIDLGACSSRPGADDVPADEEKRRLAAALRVIRRHHPEAVVSIDTFRAEVAAYCVEAFGADIINDISGGALDADMFATVARLGVPYVLTHLQGTPQTMQQAPHYEHIVADVLRYFSERVTWLRELGQKDIILDPGFGFGKTLEHNYQLMAHLDELHTFGLPLLVGVSRKSLIYQLLGTTPEGALGGTIALQTLALTKGASLLRVHDVREAAETIRIVKKCWESN
ncbi:MAG: dihydropteroate synthase [Bacteroidaceae bacterium]|nr:dihydropteroate synthase [Bacteroidaceae bacterium]